MERVLQVGDLGRELASRRTVHGGWWFLPERFAGAFVHGNGEVAFSRREKFILSTVLAGERVGLRELEPERWLVSFVDHDIGHYDRKNRRFEPTNGIPPRRSV